MHGRWPLLASPRDRKHQILWVPGAYSAAMAMVMLVAMSTQAVAYPAYVNKSCKRDYYRLCAAYSVGTPKLRRCMERSAARYNGAASTR